MDLFYDEEDFLRFLSKIKDYKKETEVGIFAYCLMSNHVHLLLFAEPKALPKFMHKTELSYSSHYNTKYSHVGHVFQGRYNSECIDDEKYFISALRYIIRNPEQAGICSWKEYRWSSAKDYLSEPNFGLTDLQFPLDVIGGSDSAIRIFDAPNDRSFAEPDQKKKAINDQDALKILNELSESTGYDFRKNNPREKRNDFIKEALATEISVKQIERVTGISRGIIEYMKKKP